MLKFVAGDILLAKTDAIAHGIAPNDDFKQGLALSLREHWPALYKDFRHFCNTNAPKEGDVWTWKGAGSSLIYNLMTQEAPRHQGDHPGKATLANLNHSLKKLATQVEKDKIKSLSITKIATGVGGLNWADVKPLLEKHLAPLKIEVHVYETFKKGIQA